MRCPTSVARVNTPFRSRISIRGPMAALGTGDDTGQSITYYEYPSSLAAAAFAQTMYHQQLRRGFEFQDVRSRGHETAFAGVAGRRVVLEHVAGHPDSIAATRHRARQHELFSLVSRSMRHESQPGLQHGQQHAGNGKPRCPARITCRTASWHRRTTISGAGRRRLGKCSLRGGRTIPSVVLNVEPIGAFYLPNTHDWTSAWRSG